MADEFLEATSAQAFQHPDEADCVFVGMTETGKTQFLLSAAQACNQRRPGEPELDFVAAEGTSGLIEAAVRFITGRGERLGSTTKAETYRFSITRQPEPGSRRSPPGEAKTVHMAIEDGPGGALVPAEPGADRASVQRWREDMLAGAKVAKSLVLFVNAHAPKSDVLWQHLPRLIKDMLPDDGRDRSVLGVDRFLVLFTKIDLVCEDIIDDLASSARRHEFGARLTPREVADKLDPLENGRWWLGVEPLQMIRAALRRDASLAVGLASPGGFRLSTGRAFLNEFGRVATTDDLIDPEALLREWTPFGVREALSFAAFGDSASTVRILQDDDLLIDQAKFPSPVL